MAQLLRNIDRQPRSWKRRVLITINIVLLIALIVGVGGFGYAKWEFSRIAKLDLADVLRRDGAGAGNMNVLLVGSDTREELAAGQSKQFGSGKAVAGQRSDTIMILHVEPKNERAAILSIPRDAYVTLYSESGKSQGKGRINSAYESGAKSLIKTISSNFDIPIDHYAEVNFDSFRSMVNAVGGVPVRFDAPARDSFTGLNITKAGCVGLNGDQALAYVRSRHYQSYQGGRWHEDPRADLSRIDRQQDFIRRVMREAINKGARNPVTLNSLISSGVKNVKLDEGFSLGDITKVAKHFKSLDPDEVEMLTLPGVNSNVDGAAVLTVKQPDAKNTIDRFLSKPPPAPVDIPPSSISVRVLNGSGVSGQASSVSGDLEDAGFATVGTGDAKNFANNETTIRYAQGQEAKAQVVEHYISGDKHLKEDQSLQGVDVVVVTGSSFNGVVTPDTQPQTPQTTQANKPTQAERTSPSGDSC